LYEHIKNQKFELSEEELDLILFKLKNDKFGNSFWPVNAKVKLDVTELETKHFYSWTSDFFIHEKRATIESFGTRIVLFSNHYYDSSISKIEQVTIGKKDEHFTNQYYNYIKTHKSLPKIEQVING